ncbi:PorP/SprF family type IX secretion system membrane protein [Paracrocinitomix mangrovi]|uniref:PorP/SprF family type IX secretion system membrane protein n=1 Tax=Paracrocinitomix mangrovi TaxID=2862509 RepID=UPI001C8DDC83|nr:PorP/SprF family type IX secretion system membrane protein [Paracrocinitomix mangrovi]UKN03288.1 PorP/SprF family type IX secretion system membrane protein [Paracrocinitomix mangrovi]
MKKVLSLTLCYLAVNLSFAQQDKQYTHYMFDKISFNPAATGAKGYCGTVIYRNQWDRVQDAPNTTLLNLQGNIQKYNLGVGLSFTNDAIGFQRNNTVTLNAAYHYPTAYGILSGGLGLGIVNVGFSPTWIPPQTYSDALLPTATAGTGFDMNLGLYWHGTSHPYYVGLSMTHLLPPTLSSINFSVARHYYVIAGYDLDLGELGWINPRNPIVVKPSTLIKADGATMVFDLNVMGDFWLNNYSYLWGGFTYRLADAVALQLGYAFSPVNNKNVNMLKFGYSFDIMTNPLNTYGKGTHELMLNFCMFPPPPAIPRHGNPFILQ